MSTNYIIRYLQLCMAVKECQRAGICMRALRTTAHYLQYPSCLPSLYTPGLDISPPPARVTVECNYNYGTRDCLYYYYYAVI